VSGRFSHVLRQLGRRVWARAVLFTTLAVVFALIAGLIGNALPESTFPFDIGQDSVGTILQIIATSMLAVTTFSLTTMVTAYSSATTNATPRASLLLIEDSTSQNALSLFLGAFTFSLVGIIALSTGYYGDRGRTILFLGTLLVVALIVVTLLRWIAHLTNFGRMADVIDRVEEAASSTLRAYATSPTLGARAWEGRAPKGAAIVAPATGYVVSIDLAMIERAAVAADTTVMIEAMPGHDVDIATPVAWSPSSDAELTRAVQAALVIEAHRDFTQDPRLGVIALSEIGSRALSPSTNDPGTAIDVIAALHRVFVDLVTADAEPDLVHPHVYVRAPRLEDLVIDAFRPLARDGAGHIEVQIRLQKCLAALARVAPSERRVFKRAADQARELASDVLGRTHSNELRAIHRRLWSA